jgi:hypothetical protein
MKAQSRINIETAAVKICTAISRFSDVNWTMERIQRCLMINVVESKLAVKWLLAQQFVWKSNGEIFNLRLTQAGVDYLDGVNRSYLFAMGQSVRDFKNESLTGIRERRGDGGWTVSERSEITRAALPGKHKIIASKTPEDYFTDQERVRTGRKALSEKLGISEEKLTQFLSERRIKECKYCRNIGVFDKSGNGYLRERCRNCRKAKNARNRFKDNAKSKTK